MTSSADVFAASPTDYAWLLLLVDNHSPGVIQVNAILVGVLARHGEVALGLHDDFDDLSARQSLECDHRRQILFERFIVGRKRPRGEKRQHEQECDDLSVHRVSLSAL